MAALAKPRRKQFRYLKIDELWVTHRYNYGTYARTEFLEVLRTLTTQPDLVTEQIRWCQDCSVPADKATMTVVNESEDNAYDDDVYRVCATCARYWNLCDRESCSRQSRYRVHVNDEMWCEDCRDEFADYCDACGIYYFSTSGHRCTYGCGCDSPVLEFQLRNDGQGMLSNDTRTSVSMAAGEISEEGLAAIRNAIYTVSNHNYAVARTNGEKEEAMKFWSLCRDLEPLGNKWQAKQGNYTKRLSSHAYKKHGLKLPASLISQVGTLARDHSAGVDFDVEFTRDLNMAPDKYAHSDSCWWQSYYRSRCTLKSNGGLGMRTFNSQGECDGRAWIMPMKKSPTHTYPHRIVPTFNTEDPDAFVVFNGYGRLNGYSAARIMSHMAGMTYRKVTFSCDPMYVNGDSGYLIAPEDLATHYTDGRVAVRTDYHSTLYTDESVTASV